MLIVDSDILIPAFTKHAKLIISDVGICIRVETNACSWNRIR